MNQQLLRTSEDYSGTIDFLFAVMDEVIDNYKFEKKDLEKGVVYIVGTTGAGKSTLLNYLAGKNLLVIEENKEVKLELENKNDSVASIGKG